MTSIKDAMETAFNNFVKEHKTVPSTKMTLVQFDDKNDQDVVFQCVPVGAVEKLRLTPRGWTPLLDAICKLIDRTGERLSEMPESERPDQVLMVIITDGEENSSKTFNRQDVFNRVTKQRDTYKWQFIYLGANQDAIKEASSIGIPHQHAFTYQPNAASVRGASCSLISNTMSYTTNQVRGTAVPDFSDDQREDAITSGSVGGSTGTSTKNPFDTTSGGTI